MWRSSAVSRVLLLVLSEGIEKEEEEELEPQDELGMRTWNPSPQGAVIRGAPALRLT